MINHNSKHYLKKTHKSLDIFRKYDIIIFEKLAGIIFNKQIIAGKIEEENMKKKVFAFVVSLILSMVFVIAGCNKKPEGEYELELESGYRQLTIYYNRDVGYDDCDVWLWYGDVEGTGYKFHPCAYGAKMVINVPQEIEEVGYIIRLNCVPGSSSWGSAIKDGSESDRKIKLDGERTVIYTKSGDPNNYISNDGGTTLEVVRFISLADMQDLKHVKISVSDSSSVTAENVKIVDGEGNEVAIASVSGNVVTLKSDLDLSKSYTLKVNGFDDVGIVPMTYFSSKAFANAYSYSGELGVELTENSTVFRLWAPTASTVKLNLFDDGYYGSASSSVELTRGDKGVWTYTHNENLSGTYYTYTVTTSVGTQEAVDPYARSAGLNGARGMILDLDSTDPEGWTNENFVNPDVQNYTDAEIWEVHIRDFSNKITSSKYKGKYLAFTETGLTNKNGIPVGIDYLKELGITHVHLLPSFDYASVDESKDGGFNWGYDPQNYNVPEGSYSTDPEDGAKRVNEYKQMVQSLHENGIGVVMDVVYNHTFSADSNLNKIVPYYYYRYNANGTLSNGSGCGNELASDRAMVRKYMVDSVTYWQNEYNLDGFRFDLMALHDVTTMQQIEKAVHKTNPNALIYGEGWTGGTSTLPATEQSTLANIQKLNDGTTSKVNGIAMFSDVIRDGVKGSVFDIEDTGFATSTTGKYLDNVLFGVTGGYNTSNTFSEYKASWYAYNPTNVINYVSAHDNNTLWDRICHVYGEEANTIEKRTAMNRLSAAIVQTSLGIPFMQAGEEMLRSKKNADGTYNENSYNAPDDVNNINWDLLSKTSEEYKMMQYYKGLIEFRKSCDTLRLTYAANERLRKYVCAIDKRDGAFVALTMTNLDRNEKILVIYNAGDKAYEYTLPAGQWNLYINGTRAGATAIESNLGGKQSIAAISCYVYKLA